MTLSQHPSYRELMAHVNTIMDLRGVGFLLTWDQATYMPKGGAEARSRQSSLVKHLAHERLTNPEIGRLLDRLEPLVADVEPDRAEAALIRITRRDFERAIRLPSEFVRRSAKHFADSYQRWTVAREQDDVAGMLPVLERTLEISRQKADYLGPYQHPADPLIEESDPGSSVATLEPLFALLREAIVPMVGTIASLPRPDDGFFSADVPVDLQREWYLERVSMFGYDLSRGRLDATHHPFAIEFSIDDVRITTRYDRADLRLGMFASFHESGHGMYHQGLDPDLEATLLADGSSAGVHESQSRLWENVVGRSIEFWQGAYGDLKRAFPERFDDVSLEAFHRAINIVEPGPIRIRADELSYNLHVILRFELECALLEGSLEIDDLEAAWNDRYAKDLGVQVERPRDGVLQDVHWFSREIGGAFQGYALGNVLSAQLYAAALEEHPQIPDETSEGIYTTLSGFMRNRIHRFGRILDPEPLVRRVTGEALAPEPYLAYLRKKYGALYGVEL